jgi:hypothetical protein
MMVPVDQRYRLLASFNGASTHVDTNNRCTTLAFASGLGSSQS